MKRAGFLAAAAGLGLSAAGLAAEGGATAQFLWAKEAGVSTGARLETGLGLLDTKVPFTSWQRGTPVYVVFGLGYELYPRLGFEVVVPMAGTLSGGDDDFGLGNVVLGSRYLFAGEHFRAAAGLDVAVPSAGTGAVIGYFTRRLSWFMKDQLAFSPYGVLSFVRDRLTLTADLGTDLQVFTDTPAGFDVDTFEAVLEYDAAAAYSFRPNFWATLELGGYTTLSWEDNRTTNTTQLFVSPGIRYQERDFSAALHVMVPLRAPARDAVDFMALFDVRIFF